MLSFPAAIKVYLCTVPCDMRRSFDGLSMMAEHVIRCNPFSGHLLSNWEALLRYTEDVR
jgi:transposase